MYQGFKQKIKSNVEWKKPDMEEYMLYDSTVVKFKSKENQSMESEVKRVVALGRGIIAIGGDMVFSGGGY